MVKMLIMVWDFSNEQINKIDNINILAIETSCDETSVAVFVMEKVLSNIVSSQINT